MFANNTSSSSSFGRTPFSLSVCREESRMARSNSIFALLISVLVVSNAIKFELQPNTEKCIKEEFRPDTLVKGVAEVMPILGDMQVYMTIVDHENSPVYENRDLTKATFAFTSQSSSDQVEYSFCFKDQYNGLERSPRVVSLKLDVGEKEKDWSEVARKENLKPLELELRKMQDSVTTIQADFNYMKGREARHRDTNESTNSRVGWMTFSSLIVLVCLGLGQMYYLKKYFKSKKLI